MDLNGTEKDLIEILKFNINRANEIVRLYEKQKNRYLDLNIALITIISIIYGIFYKILNFGGIISLICSLTVIFSFSIANFYSSSKSNETKDISPTLCFYRGYDCEKIKNFRLNQNLGDLRTQLNNLHKYQKNYHDKVSL